MGWAGGDRQAGDGGGRRGRMGRGRPGGGEGLRRKLPVAAPPPPLVFCSAGAGQVLGCLGLRPFPRQNPGAIPAAPSDPYHLLARPGVGGVPSHVPLLVEGRKRSVVASGMGSRPDDAQDLRPWWSFPRGREKQLGSPASGSPRGNAPQERWKGVSRGRRQQELLP